MILDPVWLPYLPNCRLHPIYEQCLKLNLVWSVSIRFSDRTWHKRTYVSTIWFVYFSTSKLRLNSKYIFSLFLSAPPWTTQVLRVQSLLHLPHPDNIWDVLLVNFHHGVIYGCGVLIFSFTWYSYVHTINMVLRDFF